MSHFTKVSTVIKDVGALENAIYSMGLTLQHDFPCRYYYGTEQRKMGCKLPGPYDVAFEKNDDGTFSIDADFEGGYVEKVIGTNGSKIIHNYAIEKIKEEAISKGFGIIGKSKNCVKIYDPSDSSSGYLEAKINNEGDIEFNAREFNGKNCMKFKSFEETFGTAYMKKTEDYYLCDTVKEVQMQKEWL